MPTLVMKFGGTSVANLDRIARAAKRVALEVSKGYDVIVIVSAMSGKTNEMVGWVNETSPLYDAREYDAVVSSGENVTAGLMALRLQEMDIPARSWQGWQLLPLHSTRTVATFIQMSTASIPPTRASPTRRASLIKSRSRKCWNWHHLAQRFCKHGRSNLPCAIRCVCACYHHLKNHRTLRERLSAMRRKSWNPT